MDNKSSKTTKFLKILIIIAAFVLMAMMFHFMFPGLFKLIRNGDESDIEMYLRREGAWKGHLAIFLLSVVQVVSIMIPGMPIQIAAGLIYDWWQAFLCCDLGFICANVGVFYVVRKLGNHLGSLAPQAKTITWLTDRLNSAKPAFVVAIGCMMPGIPNGIIPYIAARTNIRGREFALAVTVSCWLQILCNCVAGHFLIRGEYGYTLIAFVIQFAVIGLVTVYRKFFWK